MVFIVIAYIVMAYIVMAYIVMAYIAMAYIVMAYIVMAYIVMAYIVMANIVMAFGGRIINWFCRGYCLTFEGQRPFWFDEAQKGLALVSGKISWGPIDLRAAAITDRLKP